jgi:DNA polymerase III alpha subunit (gram-positive type)
MKRELCIIDIETTGSIFGYHEIIEIAAIRTNSEGTQILGEYENRIAPSYPQRITPLAQNLTGYRTEDWKQACASDYELWSSLGSFWRGCTPVCHNPSFERAFITLAASQAGVQDLELDYHWIGTESLAWPLYKQEHLPRLSLSSLSEWLSIEPEPFPHRAMNGAIACHQVYLRLMELYTQLKTEGDVFRLSFQNYHK